MSIPHLPFAASKSGLPIPWRLRPVRPLSRRRFAVAGWRGSVAAILACFAAGLTEPILIAHERQTAALFLYAMRRDSPTATSSSAMLQGTLSEGLGGRQQPGAWEQYGSYLVVGGLLLMLQTALIATLALQRARRRRLEQALLESQQRYIQATAAGAIGVWDLNFETNELYVDPGLKWLLGFEDAEVSRRPDDWGSRIHPQDLPAAAARVQACVDGDTDVYEIEHRMLHKNGSAKWFLSRGSAKRSADGTLLRLVGTKVDITARRRAEEVNLESQAALQVSHREIQHLAGRLIESQDAERARIARDLHDDVSQQLAGLAIAFSGLKGRVAALPGGADLQGDVSALQQRIVAVSENIRNLSHDLHPTVLQHAGLVAALNAYCAEISGPDGVAVTCTAQGEFEAPAAEAALCLYRVTQEALRNVVAHAGARRADVRLLRSGRSAEVTIADDGQGFDVARTHESGKGLGLVSITERARLAGGHVSVVTELKKGTRVRVQIPADARATPDALAGSQGRVAS